MSPGSLVEKTYHVQTCVYCENIMFIRYDDIYTYIYIYYIYICIHIPYLRLSLIRVLQPKGSQLFFSVCIGWSSSVLIVASPGKPLTIAGWKTTLSFWDGSFSGATVDDSEIPNNHLECKKRVNNGINYQPQLVQDFWTIISMLVAGRVISW